MGHRRGLGRLLTTPLAPASRLRIVPRAMTNLSDFQDRSLAAKRRLEELKEGL